MTKFVFTKTAKETFLKLEKADRLRISEKLAFLKNHQDILSILKKIHYLEPATHRLRIGSYRLLVKLTFEGKNAVCFVLKIGHRKEIYR